MPQGRDQRARPAESLKLRRDPGSFRAWRRDAHVDKLEAEAGNPLQQSVQGALIQQSGMKRGCAGAHADVAVVELRADYGTRLAHESDLKHS
jgi:hypothetical protein